MHRVARALSFEKLATHFRGRPASEAGGGHPEEFGPPPRSKTGEGRYNHAGRPVFYMASDPETVYLELGEPAGGAYIAEVEIIRPVKVIDFSEGSVNSDTLNALIYSSLLSAPRKTKAGTDLITCFLDFLPTVFDQRALMEFGTPRRGPQGGTTSCFST